MVGGTSSARGMRSASELRDLMDTLQRKKIALENSLRANGNANPSYFSVTQVSLDLAPPRDLFLCFQHHALAQLEESVRLARIFVLGQTRGYGLSRPNMA